MHQALQGGTRASRAATYPKELCDAICEGLNHHLMREKIAEIENQQTTNRYHCQQEFSEINLLSVLEVDREDDREIEAKHILQHLCA